MSKYSLMIEIVSLWPHYLARHPQSRFLDLLARYGQARLENLSVNELEDLARVVKESA